MAGLSDAWPPSRTRRSSCTWTPSAFFIGDANTLIHWKAYQDFHNFMVSVLNGAVIEFEQVGEALRHIADEYDRADEIISLDLNTIYKAWHHRRPEGHERMQPTLPDLEFGEPFNKAFEQISAGAEKAVDTFNEIVEQVEQWRWLLGPPRSCRSRRSLDSARKRH